MKRLITSRQAYQGRMLIEKFVSFFNIKELRHGITGVIMKISENSINLGQQAYAREIEATKPPEIQPEEAPRTETRGAAEDTVSLSDNARELQVALSAVEEAPEVREETVQDLRNEVESGTYQVNPEDVADRIVGSNIDELV